MNDSLLSKYSIINLQQQKRFKSKKNYVSLFSAEDKDGKNYQWIKKEFKKKINMEKELKILQILRQNGVRVPRVYFSSRKAKVIIMEYIAGQIFLEYIEQCEKDNIIDRQIDSILLALIKWLNDFYNVFSKDNNYIMEDINFRNFIIKEDKIWGMDFENCKPGKKERDIGRICAFALSYDPPFSKWKKYMVKKFIKLSSRFFNFDRQEVKKAFFREIAAIEDRRDMNISKQAETIISYF